MELEPLEPEKPIKLVLVGERRSPTAIEKDWSWQKCQTEGEARLCANQIFDGLEFCGIDPFDMGNVRFRNIWNDDGELLNETIEDLLELDEEGFSIVGMGNKVQQVLDELEIEHVKIYHPAVRGKWRRKGEYSKHVRERFLQYSVINFDQN